MLKNSRPFTRNPGRNPSEGNENLPVKQTDSSSITSLVDPTRAPLNTIPESMMNPKVSLDQELSPCSMTDRTPPRKKNKTYDSNLPSRTPKKTGAASTMPPVQLRNRNGMGEKGDLSSNVTEVHSEVPQAACHHPSSTRWALGGTWGLTSTPRTVRTANASHSNQSENSSSQITPSRSVSKPQNVASASQNASRLPFSGPRIGNMPTASKGCSSSFNPSSVVNTVEVPHFEVKEDPSFWMDHNVQVLIRVRPLNTIETSLHGYSRCLRQDSAQSITWIGHPEMRFQFDHVACETVSQEMLFRVAGLPMVENCISGYNSSMFAYGQTGSGKTYTMLGEIDVIDMRLGPNRGMIPRIFEFLFARIKVEEESRRDENLNYSCKCSFLEIYNEQIIDLLDPSSTNLQLREDVRKGVYVENLIELEVETVNDILRLLSQGSANRKVAATNMNRESSRSHSVFTCVIESRWEKDSTRNLRYARLNLVDLAGSERQKMSGADGERLREAANINKSLSTLGHVIMVLVDLAHGKQRHIPYRDSKLTFLLQDSLGGNSKTMIIASVSPSFGSAAETLSTLRFAQRAKLIQNNAVVNEDASGDVTALHNQIRLLKEELSLLKRQNVSRSLSFRSAIFKEPGGESSIAPKEEMTDYEEMNDQHECDPGATVEVSIRKLKSMESLLAGTMRREQMADATIEKLQAEIEQLNCLVRQREEDTRCAKMMLRFREDKIRRMELMVDGLTLPHSYFKEENNALAKEILLLQAQIDRNPEVTRFALENIRLLDQLRRYQEFYEEGERDVLLTETGELRDQLLAFLEAKSDEEKDTTLYTVYQEVPQCEEASNSKRKDPLYLELKKTCWELGECRNRLTTCLELNAKFRREIDELNTQLTTLKFCGQEANIKSNEEQQLELFPLGRGQKLLSGTMPEDSLWKQEIRMKHADEIMNLQLELEVFKIILSEERIQHGEIEEMASQIGRDLEVANEELRNAKSIIEALESQQVLSINELQDLQATNNQYMRLLRRNRDARLTEDGGSPLQEKVLKKMQASLEKVRLNTRYIDAESHDMHEIEMDEVRDQVEAETAEVIVCLQEELVLLQQQVSQSEKRESKLNKEKRQLKELAEMKDKELRSLADEWVQITNEVSEILVAGHVALEEASNQVEIIADSFPHRRSWVCEQFGRLIRAISEKDLLIEELQRNLACAYKMSHNLEWKLRSLQGVTVALTDSQQQDTFNNEVLQLKSELLEQKSAAEDLKNRIKLMENQNRKAEICATVAFIIANRMSERDSDHIEEMRALIMKLENYDQRLIQLNLELVEHRCVNTAESEISEDILMKLNELRRGLHLLSSYLCNNAKMVEGCDKVMQPEENKHDTGNSRGWALGPTLNIDVLTTDILQVVRQNIQPTTQTETDSGTIRETYSNHDRIIPLLSRGIESSISILRNVWAQTIYLTEEKKEMAKYEEQNRKCIEHLKHDIIALHDQMHGLEGPFQFRMLEFAQKLKVMEGTLRNLKEMLEHSAAEDFRDYKKDEALSLLNKLEESQTLLINQCKELETSLISEKQNLHNEVQRMLYSNNMNSIENDHLVEQLQLDLSEASNQVQAMANIFAEVMAAFLKETSLILDDIHSLKYQVLNAVNLAKMALQDTWSEIIAKDCAVSVLHLCHIGVLLETVTGLNIKNILLYHGIHISNSVIGDLRKNNLRAKKEVEMCSILKGKLLVDIKNSFHRLARKEESVKVYDKLSMFEKKIMGLQMHEKYMLALSSSMGSELVDLIKQMDLCDLSTPTDTFDMKLLRESDKSLKRSLLKVLFLLIDEHGSTFNDTEGVSKDFDDAIKQQIEHIITELSSKDFELVFFESEYKQKISELGKICADNVNLKYNQDRMIEILERVSREIIVAIMDEELRKEMSMEVETEFAFMQKEFDKCRERVLQADAIKQTLEHDIHHLKEVVDRQHSDLSRLHKTLEANEMLSARIHILQNNLSDLKKKEKALESYSASIVTLQCEMKAKDVELDDIRHANCHILTDLELKGQEVAILSERISAIAEENDNLRIIVESLNTERSKLTEDLQLKKLEFETSSSHVEEKMQSFEACILYFRTELDKKQLKLEELEHCHTRITREHESVVHGLKLTMKKSQDMLVTACSNVSHCFISIGALEVIESKLLHLSLDEDKCIPILDMIFQAICDCEIQAQNFASMSEFLEKVSAEALYVISSLQDELNHREELIKGLSLDLQLLQESASNANDKKDELEKMNDSLKSVEVGLSGQLIEPDNSVVHEEMLQIQLQQKLIVISDLECELAKTQELLRMSSEENFAMNAQMEEIFSIKNGIEEELGERTKMNRKLEGQVLEMTTYLGEMGDFLESVKSDLVKVSHERDHFESKVLMLEEQVEMAQSLAVENEAIATEARQMAETCKNYAVDKEEEVKLLEKSVEELECTINVMENKVEILQAEAEKQRNQREELELEVEAVRHQMVTVQESSDSLRSIEEKTQGLRETKLKITLLEKDLAEKDGEIKQLKDHISELNMHAEAQAYEYKQKFKELEAMMHVRAETTLASHGTSTSLNKPERNTTKSRGSGSPFKCIGLGLAYQVNFEKDEELVAGRHRIEELEALAASRQEEIFMLNTRLAAAESMTHDVIRDLLGIKLDITNYASLLDHQEVQHIREKLWVHGDETFMRQEKEVVKLKQQLHEFFEERQSLLDEINHKHANMMDSRVALEQLQEREHLLAAEIENLKAENGMHQKRVMELEDELTKFSGQQNLHQRIHHHARIKDENNLLRSQNKKLVTKLQRSEMNLARMKEKVAYNSTYKERGPSVNTHEEQQSLRNQLKAIDEERVRLAEKLLDLCTMIFKVAGITLPVSEVTPTAAKEVLQHLVHDRIVSSENMMSQVNRCV